jgi:hypothetical protein
MDFLSLARIAFLMALVFTATSGFAQPQKVLSAGNVSDNIKTVLANYSEYLNSGQTSNPSFYSSQMEALIKDRRDYYNEFYTVGLHTNLASLKSEFQLESAQVTAAGNASHIEVLETVTMFGYPIITRAEDYPMIPAALWAISKSDNGNVKLALQRYITSTQSAVNYSITNGATTVFRVHHSLDMDLAGGKPQIIKDQFTDKEVDNGDGFDNVAWLNNSSARSKPNLTKMPDYIIYHTSIELLGQQLLNDYTKSDGGPVPLAVTSSFTYGRVSAANYRVYSSPNATTKCPGNSSIYQDTTYYNQLAAYRAVWTTTGCDDCTDYVSQAIRQGGFPTDTIWNFTPAPGTRAWKVSDYYHSGSQQGLFYWLDNTWAATTQYSSAASLQLGDLMTDSYYWDGIRYHGAGHVVIVTQISPTKYSGHTNDRRDYAWGSSSPLQWFWHIADNLFH